MNNNVGFRNVSSGGDTVGRDKISNNILPCPRQLDLLSDLYKEEVANNRMTEVFIDELNHYRNSKSTIRGLAAKLDESGFSYLLDDAEELKELISKLIIKNQHYKSAQKIITYLLAEVESIFNSSIKPKLKDLNSEAEVKYIFRTHLESFIIEKLGENVLDIFNRHVTGMVYFLTGNCHIEWKK